MKVSELISKTYDKIVLYQEGEHVGDYEDLFAGLKKDIPEDMLERDVRVFGSKQKGILDIQVEGEMQIKNKQREGATYHESKRNRTKSR